MTINVDQSVGPKDWDYLHWGKSTDYVHAFLPDEHVCQMHQFFNAFISKRGPWLVSWSGRSRTTRRPTATTEMKDEESAATALMRLKIYFPRSLLLCATAVQTYRRRCFHFLFHNVWLSNVICAMQVRGKRKQSGGVCAVSCSSLFSALLLFFHTSSSVLRTDLRRMLLYIFTKKKKKSGAWTTSVWKQICKSSFFFCVFSKLGIMLLLKYEAESSPHINSQNVTNRVCATTRV